jgi:hypothetical protein
VALIMLSHTAVSQHAPLDYNKTGPQNIRISPSNNSALPVWRTEEIYKEMARVVTACPRRWAMNLPNYVNKLGSHTGEWEKNF